VAGPCTGLTVLDFSLGMPGAICTLVMADYGASHGRSLPFSARLDFMEPREERHRVGSQHRRRPRASHRARRPGWCAGRVLPLRRYGWIGIFVTCARPIWWLRMPRTTQAVLDGPMGAGHRRSVRHRYKQPQKAPAISAGASHFERRV